jgi:hypothetical protein
MKDVGILTFAGGPRAEDAAFRNDVAEIEGRLRFTYEGWHLHPVFGGEPFHPGDRAITSLRLGRLHVHHVIDAGACVLLLLLVGEVDARIVAEVVRYVDARMRPQVPLFVLGVDEAAAASSGAVLRVAGELRAIGRGHEAASAPVAEADPAFHAFSQRIEHARDAVRSARRDARFRDDLRRHHHLSICPGGTAPLSWRLPALQALAAAGITHGTAGLEEVARRARWILGAESAPLDPRLLARTPLKKPFGPGDLAERAVALAIRDLADERLASTLTLGPALPGAVSPARVAAWLDSLEGEDHAPASPLSTSTDDDDAAAITQFLLKRATLRLAPVVEFLDPQQLRPAALATTFAIAGWNEGRLRLRAPAGLRAPARQLAAVQVTAARVTFGVSGPAVMAFEGSTEPGVKEDELVLACPAPADRLLEAWPADRLSLIPGAWGDALERLAGGAGFAVTRIDARRTSASAPR